MTAGASPREPEPGLVCEHTGLFRPECHCTACLRALLERHRPSPPRSPAQPESR